MWIISNQKRENERLAGYLKTVHINKANIIVLY